MLGRYIDSLPANARDRIVEAKGWCTDDFTNMDRVVRACKLRAARGNAPDVPALAEVAAST